MAITRARCITCGRCSITNPNQVHYRWALQQREDITDETPERERWQVTELAVRGMMSTY